MREPPPPTPIAGLAAATPTRVRFEGVLDGRCLDSLAMREACDRLNQVGLVACDAEVDGGRFSVLPDDEPLPGARFDAARRDSFVAALSDIAALAEHSESTLRCVAQYDGDHGVQLLETLFAVRGKSIHPISRARAEDARDHREVVRPTRTLPIALTVALGLLVLSTVAFQMDVQHRIQAPEADGLEVLQGPFADALSLTVTPAGWGTYAVDVSAGAAYPSSIAQVMSLKEAAETPLELAAVDAVSEGREAYVCLDDMKGRTHRCAPVDLARLLSAPNSTLSVWLVGHADAHTVRLALVKPDGFR